MLYVPKLTQTNKMVEFQPNKFVVKEITNDFEVVAKGIVDPKDKLYKFYDFKGAKGTGSFALIAKTDEAKFGMRDYGI